MTSTHSPARVPCKMSEATKPPWPIQRMGELFEPLSLNSESPTINNAREHSSGRSTSLGRRCHDARYHHLVRRGILPPGLGRERGHFPHRLFLPRDNRRTANQSALRMHPVDRLGRRRIQRRGLRRRDPESLQRRSQKVWQHRLRVPAPRGHPVHFEPCDADAEKIQCRSVMAPILPT